LALETNEDDFSFWNQWWNNFDLVKFVSNADFGVWPAEDDIMHITMQKRDKGQTWASPILGQGQLDPYSTDLEQKRLMLQRFQEEVSFAFITILFQVFQFGIHLLQSHDMSTMCFSVSFVVMVWNFNNSFSVFYMKNYSMIFFLFSLLFLANSSLPHVCFLCVWREVRSFIMKIALSTAFSQWLGDGNLKSCNDFVKAFKTLLWHYLKASAV